MTVRLYNKPRPLNLRMHLVEGTAWAVLCIAARRFATHIRDTGMDNYTDSATARQTWEEFQDQALHEALEACPYQENNVWTRRDVRLQIRVLYQAWRDAQGTPCPLKRADGTCPRCTPATGCLKRDV